jgi:anti-anti-sigma factor
MAVHDLPKSSVPEPAATDGVTPRAVSVAVDGYPGLTVIRLDGVHDLTTSNGLLRPINDAIQAGDVVVDLNGTDFIDSSVIHVLIGGRRAAAAAGRSLQLRLAADHPLRRMLDITNPGIEIVEQDLVDLSSAQVDANSAVGT